MRISFDFDPETRKVSNVTVDDQGKPRRSREVKTSHSIVLKGNSLKLTEEVLALLDAKVGDRLCIVFSDGSPVIMTPETAGMPQGGNLVTKSLTISARGKTAEVLASHGPEFSYTLKSKGYLVLYNRDKAKEEIKKIILDESDFQIEGLEPEIHVNS